MSILKIITFGVYIARLWNICFWPDECRHPSPSLHNLGIQRSIHQVCTGTNAVCPFYCQRIVFPTQNTILADKTSEIGFGLNRVATGAPAKRKNGFGAEFRRESDAHSKLHMENCNKITKICYLWAFFAQGAEAGCLEQTSGASSGCMQRMFFQLEIHF